MKAYYTKEASGDSSSSSVSATTSTSKDSSKTLANIESAAEDLKKASETLRTNGDKSLFTKKQTTDKDGNVSYEYDTDKIYKAVSDFVDSYNKMLKEGGDSNTNSILRSTKSMVNLTKANSNMLSKVGITIGTDNKLSIDETAWRFVLSRMMIMRDLLIKSVENLCRRPEILCLRMEKYSEDIKGLHITRSDREKVLGLHLVTLCL
jgi:flagellar capping protein FliD